MLDIVFHLIIYLQKYKKYFITLWKNDIEIGTKFFVPISERNGPVDRQLYVYHSENCT